MLLFVRYARDLKRRGASVLVLCQALLKELLTRFDLGLSDVAFASRMSTDSDLRDAVQSWLETEASRPEHVDADDWLTFEQAKHQKLLTLA